MFIMLLLITSVLLIVIDWKYHSLNHQLVINDFLEKKYTYKDAIKKLRRMEFGTKKYDNLVGAFPFIWTYILYYIIIQTYHNTSNFTLEILLILLLMPIFTSLREITHCTTHNVLTKNKKLGFWLTNIFFQYPLLLNDIRERYERHTLMHHKYTCIKDKDPVIDDLLLSGLHSEMTPIEFIKLIFYPLTYKAIYEHFMNIIKVQFSTKHGIESLIIRNVVTLFILLLFIYNGYYIELLYLYIVPILFIYPLFTWITQLIEHRWLIPLKESLDKIDTEMTVGRATEYKGITGVFLNTFFLYYADRYHLAHSLVPRARWNYLAKIDFILKQTFPSEYLKNASSGLIIADKDYKYSAFSELYERVVTNKKA